MDAVKELLVKNGFSKIESNHYVNYMCEVKIFKNHYHILENSKSSIYSDNLNIYWLIGYLTYYDLMDKNYVL